jgi:hypothetical protein
MPNAAHDRNRGDPDISPGNGGAGAVAPRCWSRDDILAAARVTGMHDKHWSMPDLLRILAVLEFAEQNAGIRAERVRDGRGRYAAAPEVA